MRDKLFSKGLVAGIIVLFIIMSILSTGFSANAISSSKDTISNVCEPCNTGCDMELVEIIPYYCGHHAFIEFLHFGCKVRNVGYEPCSSFGFKAVAYKVRNNEKVNDCSCSSSGELWPGEERTFLYRAGMVFDDFYFPPTRFRINFTTRPNDPNKNNNYAEAIYLVWGGFMGHASYIKIKDTTPHIMPRTLNNPFLDNFSVLKLLLYRFRI